MRNHRGGLIAAGVLCSVAATVTAWSGSLASVSGTLHSGTVQHVSVHAATKSGR